MSDSGPIETASITLPPLNVTAPATTHTTPKATPPYTVKKLNFTFQMAAGSTFTGTGSNQLTLTGLRAAVHIEFAVQPNTGPAVIQIFGMTLDDMNQLSRAGLSYEADVNFVLVQAGDDVEGMTTVFNGLIFEAHPNMNSAPQSFFLVKASSANIIQLKPAQPISFNGATPAATALEQIIKPAGLTLQNNGVTAVLSSPYFSGSTWDQINAAVRAANCFSFLDNINNVLAIWPKDVGRGGQHLIISPETGMIGYPDFQAKLVVVRTLFNATVASVQVGDVVEIRSQLKSANGKFAVVGINHDLASQLPDGPWETTILCNPSTA